MKKFNTKKFIAVLLCALMLMTSLNLDNIFYAMHNEDGKTIDSTISSEDLTESVETTVTEVSELTEDELAVEVTSLDELANEVTALSQEDNLDSESVYATKRLIVLSDTSEFDTMEASSVVSYDNLYILSYETVSACKKAYKSLSENKNIISVEIDSVMETEDNDNAEASQSTETDTELKKYLDSLEASKEIKVAILDTGIDTTNETFKDRVIDLEINLSSSGEENSISDDNGHGTEMATIIANNTSDYVKLMPIKVANADGKATVLNTYLGIQKAIENGADIINISMNTYKSETSQVLTNLISEATDKGIVVVVSAGNNSTDTENITPANIDSAIVVSAIDNSNNFADYSNYGETVDYCSYGIYGDKTGTSYAAASVTGILADTLSKELDASILDQYAIDLGNEGKDIYYGNGLVGLSTYSKSDNNFNFVDQDKDTILDMPDFEQLSDEEINTYIDNSEPWQIGKYLTDLSEADYKKILARDTEIVGKITLYDTVPDPENEDTVLTVNPRVMPYYKMCLEEYETEKDNLDISTFTRKTGYYTLAFSRYDGSTGSVRINVKFASTNNDNSQTLTVATATGDGRIWLSNASGTTNSFALKAASTKMASNKYSILYVKASISLPAYCYMGSGGATGDRANSGRMNFKYYTQNADEGGSSLTTTSSNVARTPDFYMSVNVRNMNIGDSGDSSNNVYAHNTLTLKILCGHNSYLHDCTAATCTVASTENYYCSVCGAHLSTTHGTAALGHTWPGYWSYDANNHWQLCGRAGDAYMVNPTAHTFVASVIKDATCTSVGTHRYTCSTCGYYYDSADIPALGHVEYLHDSTPATCTSASTENYYCSRCGAFLRTTHATNALGHNLPSSYSYATNNNIANGLRYKNCTRCGIRLETAYLMSITKGTGIASATTSAYKSAGSNISLSATLATGYHDIKWRGYTTATSFTMPSNAIALTVSATINTSTLKVNPNGGTWNGSTSSQSFTQNYNTTKSIPVPTRTGYTFTGWTRTNSYGSLSSTTAAATYTFGATNNVTDTLTANWELITIDKPVTINWVDKSNAYGSRPANVVLKVMNGSTVVKTVTLSGNNSVPVTTDTWTYKFTGLQKYDTSTGKEINYTLVEEQPVSLRGELEYNVSPSSDTWTVTNTAEKHKEPVDPSEKYGVTITGTITWKDDNDKYHFRPEAVVVELYQNGKLYDSQTVTGDSYTFTGLDMIDENLNKYEYTIEEKAIDNYSTTYKVYDKSNTVTDSAGNTITTTTLHSDITNTFKPEWTPDNPGRVGDNQLIISPTVFDKDGNIADTNTYAASCIEAGKTGIYITLKQLKTSFIPVDEDNGVYKETFGTDYSGIEYSLRMTDTEPAKLTDIHYGKYEICIEKINVFTLKELKELSSENAVFSYENGKYYVTFSFENEHSKENLGMDLVLNSNAHKGYQSSMSINNFFKVTK